MLDDLKRALVRAQGDYGFYIDCQTNPAAALAGYDLTAGERSALTDSEKLSDMLMRGIGILELRPSLTVKISGKHDWVNATKKKTTKMEADEREADIATEVAAIRQAQSPEQRTRATLRLMELIG
jgi:hypothetical protein